jgi:hypothetical protein
MNLPEQLIVSTEVLTRQVGDEVVLLDLASGNYFGLEAVGARIWQLLGEARSTASIRDTLLAEYDAPADTIEADLQRLVAELISRGLVTSR